MASPVAGGSRTRLQVDERRAQLIELGRRLFNQRPYDDISIDDIADEAGISKGLLYHYFSSKRGFYLEVIRASSDQMRAATEPDPSLSPLEQLDTCLDAYLAYVEEAGPGYATLLRSGVGTDSEVLEIVEEMREVVVRRVLRGLGIGEPHPALRTAIRAWVGFLEGGSLDWVEHRDLGGDVLKALFVKALLVALETCVEHGVVLDTPQANAARETLTASVAGRARGPSK